MYKIKESEKKQFERLSDIRKRSQKRSVFDWKRSAFFWAFHLHDEALHCLEEALKYDRIMLTLFFWLAVCYYFDVLEYAEAREALTKSIRY